MLAALPDALPADHPSRVELTEAIGELTGILARRQRRRFQPIVPGGASFGVHSALTVVMALAVLLLGVEALGLYHPEPLDSDYGWPLAFYGSLLLVFAGFAARAWRRFRRST